MRSALSKSFSTNCLKMFYAQFASLLVGGAVSKSFFHQLFASLPVVGGALSVRGKTFHLRIPMKLTEIPPQHLLKLN